MAKWKNDNTLKESRRPMREARKSYFYGVKPYVMIWHGAYNDPEIRNEKTGKVRNYYDIEDSLWDAFNEYMDEGYFAVGEDEDDDSAFERFVQEHSDLIDLYFGA